MKKTESGMHEIKNKRRPRAVENKKEGLHLQAKKRMSRTSKAIVTLCSVLVLVLGVYGVGSAFARNAQRNTVDLNYGSPSVPVAEGEVYSLASDYTPVDVFARLNWTFSKQSLWYGEMHGTVDTVIQQSITTYKQYENGILISADLTESSLIKSASQFCYLKDKDRVIWRKPASKNYDGLNTEWQTGAPYNTMTIGGEHGFKATNGLPAYELSVYVIAEDTVASASPVTATEDGKFKITYNLKPETWQEEVDGVLTTKGATAYYINQMIFTGGLTTPPEFNAISVTFTFDENWQVFQTDIEEKYSAKYGPIAAPCVSTSTTKYEYNTPKAHSDAYEEYFYQYAEGEVNNGTVEKEITALDCLAEGFGSVLTAPTVLDLDLKIGDTPYHGIVDLDLSEADFTAFDLSALTARVKLGALSLWVEQGNAYLNYGGLKVSLKIDELIALVKDLTAEQAEEQADGQGEEQGEEQDILSALADGKFTLADGKAELHSVLPLLGLNIPVDFYFTIGENREIAVEKVTAQISIGDSLDVGAHMSFGEEHLPALSASEKAEFVPLMPYVSELVELFSADVLHADISYKSEEIAISGGLDLRLDGLALAGEIQADASLDGIRFSKKVRLSYTDGTLYLDLDGIKVQTTLEEGIALLEQYVTLPDADALSGLDLGALVNLLLSEDFAAIFSSSEENGLLLAVKGSELLSAFGIDFALGEVKIGVGEKTLSAEALGAKIELTAGTDVALDTSGYTSILPYVQSLIALFSNEDLAVSLSYSAGEFTAAGEIMLNLASGRAAGTIVLGYGSAQKTLSVIYEDNFVYLGVEGLQIKANVGEAAALISSLTGAENDLDAKALINKVLELDFGSVIGLGEENDTLTVLIAGTELLNALGIEFDLDTVTLRIDSESIQAEALGAKVTIKTGKSFETNTDNYIDILQYANTVATMIENGYLSADVSYTAENLTVTGQIELALKSLEVQGTLAITYGKAKQEIKVIYGEGIIYLEIGGMKVRADVKQAVELIGRFIDLPTIGGEETDLIEELLSMDFKKVFTLTEEKDTLSLAIAGTELLSALGIEFDLDTVTLRIDSESIQAEALGAKVTVKAGASFTTETADYIDILQYANTVATMIEGGYLSADVSYTAENLTVTGKIELAIQTLEVQGTLSITYGKAKQEVKVIYGEGIVYLEIGGMKVRADVKQAVELIGRFIDLPTIGGEETDLIEELLSMDFKKVFTLTEDKDTLSLAIAGTELLSALGIEFDLDTVTLRIDSESIQAEALGAKVTITAGKSFTAETADYIDILQYANTVATMIEGGYLSADISYTAENLTVTGKIELALKSLEVQGTLSITYGKAKQEVKVIYGEGIVYLEIGGMKVRADVKQAVELIGRFMDLPTLGGEETDLIEELLSMDFKKVFTLTEEKDTLSLAIAGTELLSALGIEFDLNTVTLRIDSESIQAEALGAKVKITAGKSFQTNTDNYIDILQYANTVATMIEGGYLSADVSYTAENLTVTGQIELALKSLEVQGTLSITYGKAKQEVKVIYGEGIIYLEIGGMKVRADVKQAVELIGRFIDLPTLGGEETDLIEELLSMDFKKVFTLTEEKDTLSLAIAGTELLNALGIEFDLDAVTLRIDGESIQAEALSAKVKITAGKSFQTNTDNYIDILQYANTVATMIENGYLSADVTYTAENLTVTGKIELALKSLEVQGTLAITYGKAKQEVKVIYGEGIVYLEIGGMKVRADVKQAVELIGRFIDLPTLGGEETDLIEELLSMDFKKVFTLTEEKDTLSLAIAGTELLSALGIEFDLDTVTLKIDSESIQAEALGAKVTVKAGNSFQTNTDNYIDILQYANTVATMIENGYLSADVSYTAENLTVTGQIELALKSLEVQGTLSITYGKAKQEVKVIYGEGVVYLEIGGMKVRADVKQAVELIGRFIDLPTIGGEETDLIEELLSMDFKKVFTLTEEKDTLSLAIAGTELLSALGIEFDLDTVTLRIDGESIQAEALGAKVTVKAGKSFQTNTDNYIDILQYANTVATMIEGGYLSADVSYTADNLTVTGKIELAIQSLEVQGTLSITYGKAIQEIKVIYGEGVVYLEIGGMKVRADVKQAVELIGRFIDLPTLGGEETDLIEELLSMDFKKVFTLTEEKDTLSLAIAGTELLNALGIEFDLDAVTLRIDSESIQAEALGAKVTITAGASFTAETADYIDILQYANTVATMIEGGYLSADVSYTAENLTVTGQIELALKSLEVQGTLSIIYGKAKQEIKVIYGEGIVYLEIGGMKVRADVRQAVELIGRFIDLPTIGGEETDLIEELLSMDFKKVFTLTEEKDTLSLAIAGTELLNALGIEFDLDTVTLRIDSESIQAEALGAKVTVKAGNSFQTNTDNYIDILQYANTVATMIEGGYLSADVSYTAENLTVTGKIELALKSLEVQGTLSITYGKAKQEVKVIYEEGIVYLEIGGMKVRADVKQAVELIGRFIDLPTIGGEETDLIEELLSMDFKKVFTLTEEKDTLSLAIAGTELLSALGIEFDLDTVTLKIDGESIQAEALGAKVTIKAGKSFETNTDNYIDILQYANTVATMIEGGYLSADITYTAENLTVTGKIELALKSLEVQGTLSITYGKAKQEVKVIYGEGIVYLEIGGMKVRADVKQAVELIGRFIDLPTIGGEETDLIEELLSMDFKKVFTLTEEKDTLSLAIAGTELLNALGIEFDLDTVTLKIDSESVQAEALGAKVKITAGASFTTETADYIDILQYANTVATMIEGGYLSADVSYTAENLTVTGQIELALKSLEVQGTLSITYGKAKQEVKVIYGEGVVYLEIGGMKVRADVKQAVELIGRFIDLPTIGGEETDLIEELLSMDFKKVFTLTEEKDTLSLAIAGTELLNALGIEFDLDTVTLRIDGESIQAEALSAKVKITAGKSFQTNTDNYIDILQYANTVATMIENGYLSADVSYTAENLTVTGKIELALKSLEVQGTLSITYGKAKQEIKVIYGEGVVYLEIGGMKVRADVRQAVELIGRFIDLPTIGGEETDLIEELLSMDFKKVFTLTEEKDTLSLAIAGTELLNALGIEFDLDAVTLRIDSESIQAEALSAKVKITAGASFTTETADYIDILQYANTVATMIEGGYLSADVTYTAENLTVTGKIELALKSLEVQGTLSITYGKAKQEVKVIYGEGVVYLEIGGMKVRADVRQAVELIGRFIDLPTIGGEETDLIEELLSMDFKKVFTLTEEKDTLSLAIAGTELLNALGIEFDLDTVTLRIDGESIQAEALGAKVTVKAGASFTTETEDYIDILQYANTVATMIEGGYLSADVTYTAENLTVTGKIELALKSLEVQGTLSITYGKAKQEVKVIYGEGVVYLEIGGMKVRADVKQAVELIGRFIDLPTIGGEETDLIEELLSMDFKKVFTLTEDKDTLSLAIAGTELLNALGIEFDLDTVTLKIDSESIQAEALGAKVKITAGASFTAETADYIDILQYANTVATMIEGGYLNADVSYTAENLTVTGKIELALKSLEVQGTLSITYGKAKQEIKVIYGEGIVYLEIGGMKVRADVKQAVELIGRFIDLPTIGGEETDLIEELLSMDFKKVFTLTEEKDTLSLAIAGTELLNALGIEFDLDTVTLKIDSESVQAEALGAKVKITAGASFTTETADYIDILQYANTVATMIEGGYLSADVSYTAENLTVTGKIELAIQTLEVQGTLSLNYNGDVLKQIGIVYAGDVLYLTVYGAGPEENLKVSLGAKEAIGLVTSLVGASGDSNAEALIEKLLCLDLKKLIPVFEEAQSGDALKLTVAGNELLSALGAELELGDVQVEISKAGKITAKTSHAEITVMSGADFSVDTVGYLDLSPLLGNIATILTDKALALCGDVVLSLNGFELDVEIENAVLSFENGINFRLHAFIYLQNKVKLEVSLDYGNGAVQFACGALGAKIVISEVGSFEAALLNVYGDLYAIVGNMLVDNSKNPLPAPDDLKELLNKTSGEGDASAPAWTEIVKVLTFATTEHDVSVRYGDLLARLFFPSSFGFFGAELRGSVGSLSLDGTLYLKNATYSGTDETGKNIVQFLEMPKIDYLGTEEFQAIIGYLGSAVDLLNATDLTLTFEGTVTSTEEIYQASEGVKYDIKASMSTHRGASNLIHLDVDGKNLWVDTDVFAHASINVKAASEADNSLYIDLFILDGAPEKDEEGNIGYTKDNMLDFYVTLSQFGDVDSTAETVPGYEPVRLYAPSDEILTLLSSALPMFGIDVEILNNYMIEKWLSLENVAQLKAFGDIVSPLLSGLLGAKETPSEPADETPAESAEPLFIKDYLKGLNVTAEKLSIELNSEKLYNIKGLRNVTATLEKEADTQNESGNYDYGKFTRLDLLNIYDKAGKENTSLTGTIDYNQVTPDVPSGEYQSFLGADKLILILGKSATHGVNEAGEQTEKIISGEEKPHHYLVNNYFYIDGSIGVNLHLGELDLITLNIDIVAISVTIDEEGKLALNLRLEYAGNYSDLAAVGGLALGIDGHIINGDSTVDLTLKDGMVYMKRVQTNYYSTEFLNRGWKEYETPVTRYRAMPTANFTANIFDHLGFLFNMGDKLWAFVEKQIANSSNKETTPAEKVDFGRRLTDVLKSYTFHAETKDENGDVTAPASWDLVLNGDALAKGVLGDIAVGLKEDNDGYFHDISVSATIVSVIAANITLRWHNPGGVMEGGAADKTHDIAAEVADPREGFGGMIEKLNLEEGWLRTLEDGSSSGVKFLEGQETTVSYKYQAYTDGTVDLGTQKVLVSTGGDGFAENTLYSVLGYPALPDDNVQFTYRSRDVSAAVGKVLESHDLVIGEEDIQRYEVTFYTADKPLGEQFGWEYDAVENRYFRRQTMKYGSAVDLGGKHYTVTGVKEFEIDAVPMSDDGRTGVWQAAPELSEDSAIFTATYPASVTYQSEVQFTIENCDVTNIDGIWSYTTKFNSTEYELLTPAAAGYTFLGWYMKDENGWKPIALLNASEVSNVTVEALWATQTYDFTMSGGRNNNGSFLSPKYQYNVSISETEELLVGAFASDEETNATRTVKREVYIGTGDPGYTGMDGTSHSEDLGKTGSGVKAYVKVTVTYTDDNGNTLYETVVEKNGSYNLLGNL